MAGAVAEIIGETSSTPGGTHQTEGYCTGKVYLTVHFKTEERSRTVCIQCATILNAVLPFVLV